MNILLSSVGRRPYLVRWFQEALRANDLSGRVIAADSDGLAPSRSVADGFIKAPPVADADYRQWLSKTIEKQEIDLAISINDFELSEWALLDRRSEWDSLVRLESEAQALVEDKLAMSKRFEDFGIPTPKTWIGGSACREIDTGGEFVTKGRFGSASRGLQFTDRANLEKTIEASTKDVTTRQGRPADEQETILPADLVIVQERVKGIEYGLDVVSDLGGKFAGVLARRKISMRAGETDRAESVKPGAFEEIARKIAEVIQHPGTIDIDVIVDAEGVPFVIDVNPRFGGGYPFSHLAGARIPNAYVAWARGLPIDDEWLNCEPGVISGKSVETLRIL